MKFSSDKNPTECDLIYICQVGLDEQKENNRNEKEKKYLSALAIFIRYSY